MVKDLDSLFPLRQGQQITSVPVTLENLRKSMSQAATKMERATYSEISKSSEFVPLPMANDSARRGEKLGSRLGTRAGWR